MSELHVSLIIIGLLFIVAVFVFNRWQERKFRKHAEKMFRGERQDVLFDEPSKAATTGERIEPSFHSAVPAVEEAPATARREAVAVESNPVQHVVPTLVSAVAAPLEEERSHHRLIDESIDLIGVIHLGEAISAEQVKGLIIRAQTFSKPVFWEGMQEGRWTEISAAGEYTELRMGLQLADRRGPATSAEISRFIALVAQFAVELDGTAQTEAENSAAARATELDGFCADVDVEIGVNLVANRDSMPATKLRALAEASGLKLSTDGVFHLYDDHGVSIFTLRNSEPRPFIPDYVKNITTHGITLLLDVPRVGHGVKVFSQMLQLGQHIAHALGGDIVDDNGKPLTDAGVDTIRQQLGVIYREMEGFGIPAGSSLALRLFS